MVGGFTVAVAVWAVEVRSKDEKGEDEEMRGRFERDTQGQGTAGTLLVLLTLSLFTCVKSSSECGNHGERKEPEVWISDGGFLLLILGVCAMFWGLAVVCEEYFVPALNILCEELNIPDDVAGATFMAAGASSPEMFTSFIALFVNHSAIGVGTVVGSEIFNHMIICAGSVMYSTTGVLQLERNIFTRDVLAYLASLIALIWALKGSIFKALPRIFDSDERKKCLDVTPAHAIGLVLLYVLYVVVSAYFQKIVKWLTKYGLCSPPAVPQIDTKIQTDENPLTTKLFLDLPVEVEEGGAEREEDRMAALLSSVVEASLIPNGNAQTSGRADPHTPSTKAPSMAPSLTSFPPHLASPVPPVLMRSLQLQRSLKYRPSAGTMSARTSLGGSVVAARADRLPAVDWTKSRASFVNDAPLYTWRSSGVRLEYLEPQQESQILTGNHLQSPKNPACCQNCGINSCLSQDTDEIVTCSVSPVQVSSYLYLRVKSSSFLGQLCPSVSDKWELRYYTVDRWGFHSRKGKSNAPRGPHIRIVDLVGVTEIRKDGNKKNGIHLVRGGPKDEEVVEFSAPTEEIQQIIIERLEANLAMMKRLSINGQEECNRIARRNLDGGWTIVEQFEESSPHTHSIIDPPKVTPGDPTSNLLLVGHYCLYPLKILLYYSLPDVTGNDARKKYIPCLFVSIVWLAILSFVMIMCCDGIGSYIGASPVVMGLTLSAVGTSFPNLWSSMLVARQGLGDMAVGNAFGSNTFNICVALGLPWLTRAIVTDFSSYQKMEDDGIVFMLILLIIVVLVFYVVVWLHEWQIRTWMSYYFIATYFAIMIYAIING